MQQVNEELQLERQELFFQILDDFISENYEVDEDYVMTEEDAYITSILLDYFEENYKFPTLEESTLEAITGYDTNTKLYEELAYILMDESVGTFVAGAAHGIRNFLSARAAKKATAQKDKAKEAFGKYTTNPNTKKKPQLKVDVAQKQHDATDYGKGVVGTVKKAFNQGKIDKTREKAEKARSVMQAAETKRKSAVAKNQNNRAKTGALANRIDTGISNVQNRVKQAISTGASRVGGFLGRAAGAFAR